MSPKNTHAKSNAERNETSAAAAATRKRRPSPPPRTTSAAGSAATSPESRPSSSSSSEERCESCASYLRAALSSSSSRPVELLRAMGAGRPSFAEDGDGRGVTVAIPSSASSNDAVASEEGGTTAAGEGGGGGGGLMRRISARLRAAPTVATGDDNVGRGATIAATSPEAVPAAIPPISLSISCSLCSSTGPEGSARAYVKGPSPLSVVLCSNRLSSPDEINEVLVHELIHVYDVAIRNLDLRDCESLAYSEIRAAREAECSDSMRWRKGSCVRNKAIVATGNMFGEDKAKGCVCGVFERAMADRSPFDIGGGGGGGSSNGGVARGAAGGAGRSTTSSSSTTKSRGEKESRGGCIDGRPYSSSYSKSFLETTATNAAAAAAGSSSVTGFASSSSSSRR